MLSEQQQRILGYFIEEAKDHLNTIEQGLLNLQSTIEDPEMVSEVFRAAHSVKGGAAMLGLSSIQHTSHRLEDYFKVLKECPLKIDQKLESLFLRVFDTLQELLEHLQGPFGLTEEKAAEAMAAVEPVFSELGGHLAVLVSQAGGTPPEDVELTMPAGTVPVMAAAAPVSRSSQPIAQEESALQLIFQSDVPARLREMLQLFKQVDDETSRQQLQEICRHLGQAGEQFDLPNWTELLEVTSQAIANYDNSYRTLAPIVIKDVKQAQELVLAGRAIEICCSDGLQALLPLVPEEEVDLDFADFLASGDLQDGSSSELLDFELTASDPYASSMADGSQSMADLLSDESLFDDATFLQEGDALADADLGLSGLDADFDNASFADSLGFGNSLEEAMPANGADPNGPEVGVAELNSLADLFEGEVPDLGMTWQEEEVVAGLDDFSSSLNADESNDFSDLLFDQDGLEDLTLEPDSEDEDLSGLLDRTTSQFNQTPAASTASDMDLDSLMSSLESLPDEFAADLNQAIPVTSHPPSNAQDLDNLNELFAGLSEDDELTNEEGNFLFDSEDADSVDSMLGGLEAQSVDDSLASLLDGDDEPASDDPLSVGQDVSAATDSLTPSYPFWQDSEVTSDLWTDPPHDLAAMGTSSEEALDLSDSPFSVDQGESLLDPFLMQEQNLAFEDAAPNRTATNDDLSSDLWAEDTQPIPAVEPEATEMTDAQRAAWDALDLMEEIPLETFSPDAGVTPAEELVEFSGISTPVAEERSPSELESLLDPESDFSETDLSNLFESEQSDLTASDGLSEADFSGFGEDLTETQNSLFDLSETSDTDSIAPDTSFSLFGEEATESDEEAEVAVEAIDLSGDFLNFESNTNDDSELSFEEAFFAPEVGSAIELELPEASSALFLNEELTSDEAISPLQDSESNGSVAEEEELLDFNQAFGIEEEPADKVESADAIDFGSDFSFFDTAEDASEGVESDLSGDFSFLNLEETPGNEDSDLTADFSFLNGAEETSNETGSDAIDLDADFGFLNPTEGNEGESLDLEADLSFLNAGATETSDLNAFADLDSFLNSAESSLNLEPDLQEATPDSSDLIDLTFDAAEPFESEGFGSEAFALDTDLAAAENVTATEADALGDLDALLNEAETATEPDLNLTASNASDFSDLDSLLSEADLSSAASLDDITASSGDFDDLDALLNEADRTVAAETPAQADSFSDLDALLSDESTSGFPISSIPEDDFSDLDALLSDAPLSSPPQSTEIQTSTRQQESDGFDDLEKLLEDADQTLGGSSASRGSRSPALSNARRPNRPGRGVLSDQTMRVSVKHLDNLNNLVGELVVNRNSLEQAEERLRQFLDNLLYQVQQLSDVGQRMRDLYERSLLESSLLSSRRSYHLTSPGGNNYTQPANHATGMSFDALEMDRFTGFHTLSQEMIELIVRVRESASDIDFVVDETDQITRNFRQITTQLQEGLTRSRMVPFAQTADRLPRAVRDISLKCGKQAELVVEGRDTLIDKMILEQLYDPMTHLVNNAITHGVETPEERSAAGKPAMGRITIRSFHQGNQTVISVMDDGAGIDPDKVKRKAIEKRLITPQEAQTMSRLDVYDLLFHHGFSTKDKADDFAGRGVGMDVVRTSLNDIRGVINIDSAVGRGTTFTIRLPLTLSISKALCCISNRARIAFPMDGVEDMLDVPQERIQHDEQGRPCIQWRDTLLPFQPLSELLRYNRSLGRGSVYGGNQEDDIVSVVVLRSNAGNYLALQVDQVLGEQEIVIKQLEGPVPKPVGVAGATVLGDGRIMPIADVLELIDLSMGRIRRDVGSSLWEKDEEPPVEMATKTEPTVLIVDDSITVRELLSMTFSKIGYRVEQARDGQEAWEKLRSGLPCDLVFCDIEMPRMDGLELLSRIQKDGNLSHLPIAMLTSRGADRHRQMAIQLGAKGYFTKPYLEEALLDAAQRMLKGEVLVTNNV